MFTSSLTLAQLREYKQGVKGLKVTHDAGLIHYDYNYVASGYSTSVTSSPGIGGGTTFSYDTEHYSTLFWHITKYDSTGKKQWTTDVEEKKGLNQFVLSKNGDFTYEIRDKTISKNIGKADKELWVRILKMDGAFTSAKSVYPKEGRWKQILHFSTGSDINIFIQPEKAKLVNEIGAPIKTLWVTVDQNLNTTTNTISFPTFNSNKINNITFSFIGTHGQDALFMANYTNSDVAKGKEVQSELITISSDGSIKRKNLTNVIKVSRFAQKINAQNHTSDPFFIGNACAYKIESKTKAIFYMYFGEEKKSINVGKINFEGNLLWKQNFPFENSLTKKSIVFQSEFALYNDKYISVNLFEPYYKTGRMIIIDQSKGLLMATENYPAKRMGKVIYRTKLLNKTLGTSDSQLLFTKLINGELNEESNSATTQVFTINGSAYSMNQSNEPESETKPKNKKVTPFYFNIIGNYEYVGWIRDGEYRFKTFPLK